MTATPPEHAARTLAYLDEVPISAVKGFGTVSARRASGAGVDTVAKLLLHAPRRYLDRKSLFDIAAAPLGEEVTIGGTVLSTSKRRISGGRTMIDALVSDGTSTVRCVWFNPYLRVTVGNDVMLAGKLDTFRGSLQMSSPDMQDLSRPDTYLTGRVVPIYASVGGVGPTKVRTSIANALRRSLPMVDVIPAEVRAGHGLVDRSTAFQDIHLPLDLDDVGKARRRLIFDEFLRIQMMFKARAHDDYESQRGVDNIGDGELTARFLEAVPYELTSGQGDALAAIRSDMEEPTPMHRLLHGEVGSGKTIVVVLALLASVEGGHQGAVMAPTEVLATQHYLGTVRILEDAGLAPSVADRGASGTVSLFAPEEPAGRTVRLGLFTGSGVAVNFSRNDVDRATGLEWLADGTIDIAFGTQALIQEGVELASLGLAVVDEQHRFGVEQRVRLRSTRPDGAIPDLLLLTATPIPRTLAMVQYGDLKVSSIPDMPAGRTPVHTTALSEGQPADRAIDAEIEAHVAAGGQVYVVCPLVDPSPKIEVRAATDEYARIASSLPAMRVGLLHGQMPSLDKAEVMDRFRSRDIDVLVSTTVIEVGIDVPNATLIVIRNAERFGLSQLHQLRGRVGRGDQPGSCVLAADASTDEAEARIAAMLASNDGYHLAERDLEIRGQGKIFGADQSGAADLRLGHILRDADLVEAAATVAELAIGADRHMPFVEAVLDEATRFLGSLPEAADTEIEQ
ncbi:MAG: ATP-dependent DNA helicase RecG [Acidimicrobiia bacterium]